MGLVLSFILIFVFIFTVVFIGAVLLPALYTNLIYAIVTRMNRMSDDKVLDHWKDPEWLELFYKCHEDEWRQEAMEDYEIEVEEYDE